MSINTEWEAVQTHLAEVPGELGAQLRRQGYRPFFLRLADDAHIEPGCFFSHPERIIVEDDVRFNRGAIIYGSGGVRIGRHARIGPRLFLHSANHDVDRDDPRAFFERGYTYAAVEIGDNVLISADVKLLPGARLGTNSFVAAGAVVPGKTYPSGAYLAGVPAKPMDDGPRSSERVHIADLATPQIAVVTHAGRNDRRSLYLHLLSVLGLPQVTLLTDECAIPKSVEVAIVDAGCARPADLSDTVAVWQLHDGDTILDDEAACKSALRDLVDQDLVDSVSPPMVRKSVYRPITDRRTSPGNQARATAFWLLDRLIKRSEPIPLAEFLEWLTLILIADIRPGRADRLFERLFEALSLRKPAIPHGSLHKASISSVEERDHVIRDWFANAEQPDRVGNYLQAIGEELPLGKSLKAAFAGSQQLDGNTRGAREDVTRCRNELRRGALTAPARFVELAWRTEEEGRPAAAAFLRDALPHCNSSKRLVGLGISAQHLGVDDVYQAVQDKLQDPAWWLGDCAIPRSVIGKPALLLSPLWLAWLIKTAPENQSALPLPEGWFEEDVDAQPLQWQAFHPGPSTSPAASRFLDTQRRLISRSLIDIWGILHVAPSRPRHQRLLTDDVYDGAVQVLEEAWVSLIAQLAHERAIPLVRLRPWPTGYSAALSIRYDVDRSITARRLQDLVAMQSRIANSAFGSWYYRHGDVAIERQRPLLECYWQEWGKHLEAITEAEAGIGTTHHSAPTSEYWAGSTTIDALAHQEALYGEFHANELPSPRPALLTEPARDLNTSHITGLTITALHFPLEAGTAAEEPLEYLDKKLVAFHRRLNYGGHIIIGTHPDLDQEGLERLFDREDLAKVWLATVEKANQRARAIRDYDNIRCVTSGNAFELVSRHDVADVSVSIYLPDGRIATESIQLLAGRSRPLRLGV